MEEGVTKEQQQRRIWLLGHSYPGNSVSKLKEPLDPRHPTRHSIWTPVLDAIQERVYAQGRRRRLDMTKCLVCNAAARQKAGAKPDWDWKGTSIPNRIKQLEELLCKYKPPILITFSAPVFVFAMKALNPESNVLGIPGAAELGEHFRDAIRRYDPTRVNVFPLLHAYVARKDWHRAGPDYSGLADPNTNYFDYAGRELGDILLKHGRGLPIWCD